MMLVEDIIKDYMATHSRLTVVGLGTFLSRGDDHQLLFTEFVTEDDGVLFETLVKSGVCELEATAMIETFVETVHKRIDAGERYHIEGVGTLRRTPVGVRFKYQRELPSEEEVEEEETAPVVESRKTEDGEPKILGASSYQDFVAEEDTKKGRRIDMLMLFAIVITLFAVCLFAYSLVIKWQMGELSLPEGLDSIMVKLFGEL